MSHDGYHNDSSSMACSCFGYCYRLAHQPHIAEYPDSQGGTRYLQDHV
nr:MAG TPA: hypothetical protein [Caudoviricetes sp.]DAO18236.1 MAG TPA: hypothetical protein [Caudoviricetes sp.]